MITSVYHCQYLWHDNTIKNSVNYKIFINSAKIRVLTEQCNQHFFAHEHKMLMYKYSAT